MQFSTENWSRPKGEVDALMTLLRNYMKTCLNTAEKEPMKVRVIGDKTGLDPDIQTRIRELEEASKDNDGLNFTIAINYGSRDEIARAVRHISEDVAAGKLDPASVTEETISNYLDTAGIPDPDLLIRTSGELRPVQLSYVAAGLHGVLFYEYALAGFHKRGIGGGH